MIDSVYIKSLDLLKSINRCSYNTLKFKSCLICLLKGDSFNKNILYKWSRLVYKISDSYGYQYYDIASFGPKKKIIQYKKDQKIGKNYQKNKIYLVISENIRFEIGVYDHRFFKW